MLKIGMAPQARDEQLSPIRRLRGNRFRKATAFDSARDACWMRFQSSADMSKLSPAELPFEGHRVLATEDLPGAVNPQLSDFQGAFGREKLIEMDRLKTFRTRIPGSSGSYVRRGRVRRL